MYIYTDIQVTMSHAIDNTTISVVLFYTIVAQVYMGCLFIQQCMSLLPIVNPTKIDVRAVTKSLKCIYELHHFRAVL